MVQEKFIRDGNDWEDSVPHEVETFNPETGPGRARRPKKNWKDVPNPRPMPDIDTDVFTTKKSVAQGFMDVALLSANADQLRTLLKTGDSSSAFFVICVVFISISLIIQLLIAISLLLKTRYNINNPVQFRRAETLNNIVMVSSVFLTAVNILATSFMPEVPGITDVPEVEILPFFPRSGSEFGGGENVEPVVGST